MVNLKPPFCCAAYSLQDIEEKTKDLQAAPSRYKVPDDAPAFDVSTTLMLYFLNGLAFYEILMV